jgi:hypothetical protein
LTTDERGTIINFLAQRSFGRRTCAAPGRQVGWVVPEETPDYVRPIRRLATNFACPAASLPSSLFT